MSGEDVYDVAGANWCPLCEAQHSPCEEADLRYQCLKCFKMIEFDEEVEVNGTAFHPECARPYPQVNAVDE